MSIQKKHIFINAFHCKTGGGLVFLNKILPYLAKEKEFEITVLASKGYEHHITHPNNVSLKTFNVPKSFLLMHLWEQFVLPFKLKDTPYNAMLCNANYVPLFCHNTVPIIHNNPSVGMIDKRLRNIFYWKILIALTRLSVLFSKKACVVAQHVIPQYAKGVWKGLESRMVVTNPGCDIAKINQKHTKKNFVAVGDFYIQKNYPFMLDAYAAYLKKSKELKDSEKLVIVGRNVDADVFNEVQVKIKQLNLEKNVEIKGHLKHDALLNLIHTSKLYLNTSSVECFNMPVLEAMSVGTAVVVHDYHFQKEVAGEAAYYVPYVNHPSLHNQNVKAWVHAMDEMLLQKNMLNSYEKKGLKRAENFTWNKTSSIFIETLKGITSVKR